jgi:hypothetical protein
MAAIFITKEIIQTNGEDYGGIFKDRVARDIHTQDLYVDVRGQWQGRRDYVVDNAIQNDQNIHIFTRNKSKDNFTYWGLAKFVYKDNRTAQVGVRGTTVRDLAYFHFVINNTDIVNQEIPRNPLYVGGGCLKKACLDHIGHNNPAGAAISQCFVNM